ncbi:MAG: dihydrolipoyl dehydrogenase [Verrucomicrobiota bacterium]
MSKKYDLIIMGAGPGGYVAAEKAGAMGKSTLLIEKAELGGVCLNEGCIPSKTLLSSAKHYAHVREAGEYGVSFTSASFDLKAAMKRKEDVISRLRSGVEFLMKKNKVDVVKGQGKMVAANEVTVDGECYSADKILIATGSSPVDLPIPGADGSNVLNSSGVLSIESMPEKVVVIGGGAIGIEFASFFSAFEKEVHVIEMMPEITPFADADVAKVLRRALKNVKFHLNAKVEAITEQGVEFTRKDKKESVEADIVVMACGRKPNLADCGFEEVGIDTGKSGIKVNDRMETSVPDVYAIGDVTGRSLLAHSASRMGEVAVNNMFGEKQNMRFDAIPWAVYSIPECAGCGMTETDAKENGYEVRTAKAPMKINGRFLAEYGDAQGICKVVVNARTDEILGIHMTGGLCSEMIFGAVAMIESGLRSRDVREMVFPHPTVSEIVRDTLAGL